MKKLIINTDGGSRANPGKAAAGFVIKDEKGQILASDGQYLGIATNNEAEYGAIKLALQELIKQFNKDLPLNVVVKSDSQLVVNQLSGNYKIKKAHLKIIIDQIHLLEQQVGQVNYLQIPRAENFEADKIVNDTLDSL